jgi:hypothetical protein
MQSLFSQLEIVRELDNFVIMILPLNGRVFFLVVDESEQVYFSSEDLNNCIRKMNALFDLKRDINLKQCLSKGSYSIEKLINE